MTHADGRQRHPLLDFSRPPEDNPARIRSMETHYRRGYHHGVVAALEAVRRLPQGRLDRWVETLYRWRLRAASARLLRTDFPPDP